MKLRNITLVEFISLDSEQAEDYIFALKYCKESEPRDVLGFGDITKKTFGDVKDLQYILTKSDAIDRIMKNIGYESIKLMSVFDFFACYRYICSEIERVNTIENELLSHDPTPEEVEAGLEGFGRFSSILQIDSLAGGDVLKYKDVRALAYEDGLTKLALDKERNEYQRRFNKILTRKRN